MNRVAHRIRRQRWEIRAPDRETAFALRAQMRRDLDSVLMPAMERAFDAQDPGDEVVHLSRLTLSLKVNSLEQLAAQLPALVAQELGAALGKTMPRTVETVHRRSLAAHRRLSLLRYLRGGLLDWPDVRGEVAAQASALRDEAARLAHEWQADPPAMRRALPTQFAALPAFFFRLLQLLPAAQRNSWLPAMLDAAPLPQGSRLQKLRRGLDQLAPAVPAVPLEFPEHIGHTELQKQAIALALAWADHTVNDDQILALLRSLPGADSPATSAFDRLPRPGGKAPEKEGVVLQPAGRRDDGDKVARSAGADQPQPGHDPDATRGGVRRTGERNDADNITRAPADEPAVDSDGLRVHSSGLVLAHPFLSRLLAARGLLGDGDRALSPHALPHAAALLHWLACARETIYEFELGLIKPLLGLNPDDPLPVAQGLLDVADREECRALLEAMVEHWPALRSTSVEALQVSFLQRPGLLRPTDAAWHLQLESESFDLLLAQLPWSISIVRLPWMTKPIFTDWPSP